MYVHICNCYFFSPLYNVINCRNFRKMLRNEKRQQYITCQMYSERPRRVFVSSYYALEGRRFKRTDTSMRSINKSSQKIWACIWHTRTTTPQLIQTILTQKRLDFFMLYKVGGGKVGGGKWEEIIHFSTSLLHRDKENNSVVRFHEFSPKRTTS